MFSLPCNFIISGLYPKRLLIGGGANLSFEEETTTQFGINKIKAAFWKTFNALFLQKF